VNWLKKLFKREVIVYYIDLTPKPKDTSPSDVWLKPIYRAPIPDDYKEILATIRKEMQQKSEVRLRPATDQETVAILESYLSKKKPSKNNQIVTFRTDGKKIKL
jgi:hypothetical protein